MTIFTDAERAFADSPRGGMELARAREDHRMREAHRGADARPWTDALEGEAVRSLAARAWHDANVSAGFAAGIGAVRDELAAREATARHIAEASLNAWR